VGGPLDAPNEVEKFNERMEKENSKIPRKSYRHAAMPPAWAPSPPSSRHAQRGRSLAASREIGSISQDTPSEWGFETGTTIRSANGSQTARGALRTRQTFTRPIRRFRKFIGEDVFENRFSDVSCPGDGKAPAVGVNAYTVSRTLPTPDWNSGWDLRHGVPECSRIDTNSRLKDRDGPHEEPYFPWNKECSDFSLKKKKIIPQPEGIHRLAPVDATHHSNWNATSVEPETAGESASASLYYGYPVMMTSMSDLEKDQGIWEKVE